MKFVRFLGLTIALCLSAWGVMAQNTAKVTQLMDALAIADVVEIMRAEGQGYAQDLNDNMLAGKGGAFWAGQITQIYNKGRMAESVRAGLEQNMDSAALDGALTFFQTKTGVQIVALENAARAAMADEAAEEIARQTYLDMEKEKNDRMVMITRFVQANDLIERNISGALTSNYQFLRGLTHNKAYEMTEDEIIAQVWGQEAEIRQDTREWVYGFLIMAYQPLSLEDLEA